MEKFRSSDANALSELLAISDTLKTDTNELSLRESIKLLATRQYRRPFLILNFLFILVTRFTFIMQSVLLFNKILDAPKSWPTVNFINVMRANFFVRKLFRQLFSSYMYIEKAATTTFVWKIHANNIDEIDTCSQFHHHFKSSFCADILLPKNYKAKLLLE